MIALTVMTGAVTAAGELTWFTNVKLQMVLQLGDWLHANHVPYRYVFPQGAQPGLKKVRPCDLMSHYVLARDPYCAQVHVPDGVDLIEREERVAFVEQVLKEHKAKVFGFGMMFHPAHYRGLEDDPMKDILGGEMPGALFEGSQNILPFRRPID